MVGRRRCVVRAPASSLCAAEGEAALGLPGVGVGSFWGWGGGDGDELPSWVAQSNSEDVSHRCAVGLGELESFSVLIPGSD